jgi:hypothetical protein
VATVDLGGGLFEPAVEAEGGDVAVVDDTKTLRTWNAVNRETTPKPSLTADTRIAINDFPLAVQARRTFFRSPNPGDMLTVLAGGTFASVDNAKVAAVRAEHVAFIDQGDQAQAYHAGAALLTGLGLKAKKVAVASDMLAAIDDQGALRLWPWTGTAPGPAASASIQADDLAATAGCRVDAPTTCDARVVFTKPDSTLALADLDSAGNAVTSVVRCRDEQLNEGDCKASPFVAGERLVAFRDPRDGRMYVGAFRDPAVTGGRGFVVRRTGFEVLAAPSEWHKIGWRAPIVVAGEDVLFITRQDGKEKVVVYHYRSDVVDTLLSPPTVSLTTPIVVTQVSGGGINVKGGGLALGDADGDGVLDPRDNSLNPNPLQTDVDADGRGDCPVAGEQPRGCDRRMCSDVRPPPVLTSPYLGSASARKRATAAALAYLKARLDATTACIGAAGLARESAAAAVQCLGTFVGDTENPPLSHLYKGDVVQEHEAKLLAALGAGHASVPGDGLHYARQVVRAYGQAANAMARVTVRPLTLVEHVDDFKAMHRCVLEVFAHAGGGHPITATASGCLGELRDHKVPGFWAPKSLRSVCVAYRHAVRSVTTLFPPASGA